MSQHFNGKKSKHSERSFKFYDCKKNPFYNYYEGTFCHIYTGYIKYIFI